MNAYLIDIRKTIAECICIRKQKIVLFPKFRKNQREATENTFKHDKDSSIYNDF